MYLYNPRTTTTETGLYDCLDILKRLLQYFYSRFISSTALYVATCKRLSSKAFVFRCFITSYHSQLGIFVVSATMNIELFFIFIYTWKSASLFQSNKRSFHKVKRPLIRLKKFDCCHNDYTRMIRVYV